jgi:hypothetical protein
MLLLTIHTMRRTAMQRRTFMHKLLRSLSLSIGGGLYPHQLPAQPTRRILLQESPLAGYQYHRASGIWPFLRVGEKLQLRREAGNPHDPNAIAVWFKNEHLGYVPLRENKTLARMMDRGERLEAQIVRLLDDDNPWRRIRYRIDLIPHYF